MSSPVQTVRSYWSKFRESSLERAVRKRKELGYDTDEEQSENLKIQLGGDSEAISKHDSYEEHKQSPRLTQMETLENTLLYPFRVLWNLLVFIVAITLQVLWVGFLFGSVLGIILLLIFMPGGFLLPLLLLSFTVETWPES